MRDVLIEIVTIWSFWVGVILLDIIKFKLLPLSKAGRDIYLLLQILKSKTIMIEVYGKIVVFIN